MPLLTTACIERVGHGFTTRQTYLEWASEAIQEPDLAGQIAQKLPENTGPYKWNEEEPEFYETFAVIDRAALEAQLADQVAAAKAAAELSLQSWTLVIFPLFGDGSTGDAIEEATSPTPSELLAPLCRAADRLQQGIVDSANPDRRAVALDLTIQLADAP